MGIMVGCANREKMQQMTEDKLPFDQLPKNGNDVQIFKRMQNPLISA